MRERDKAETMSSSIGLEEERVNDHMKIIDKARMSSKESNMKASMEEAGEFLGEDETRTGFLTFGRGVVRNSREGEAFLIIQIETRKPPGTKTSKGRDEEHTCEDLHH